MNAFKRYRKSTNIEDRRVPRDLTKPVRYTSMPDPTSVDPGKVKLDRFRADTSVKPLEEFRPSFKTAFRRKRK